MIYVVGTAFVVVVMAKERVALVHKTAAMTDLLTGLFNRRAFLEAANQLIELRGRKSLPVSVLLFDLDKFKSINDRFGHAVGDDALKVFASTAAANVRSTDIIGRLGGEEFAAILPGSAADAGVVAERLRAAFQEAGVVISGHAIGATVSIGVATRDPAGSSRSTAGPGRCRPLPGQAQRPKPHRIRSGRARASIRAAREFRRSAKQLPRCDKASSMR